MNKLRNLLVLALLVPFFVSCETESEDEYVGNWETMSEFSRTGRAYAAYFTIGDKGYVCGGHNGVQARRTDFFVYDHTYEGGLGNWAQLADFPGAARQMASGFAVNGKGYVGLGTDGDEVTYNDFYEYDPATNVWRKMADFPGLSRHSAVAFTLTFQGREYGFVGCGKTVGDDEEVLKDFYMFDPATGAEGTWTKIGEFPGTKRYGASVFILDNVAYLCAGASSTGYAVDFWKYDPDGMGTTDGAWTRLRHMSNSDPDEDYDDDYGDLQRSYAVTFVAQTAAGKRAHIALGAPNKASVWEYDQTEDLWVRRTSFYNNVNSSYRTGAVAFSFPDGAVYAGLGYSGNQYYTDLRRFFPDAEDSIYDDY